MVRPSDFDDDWVFSEFGSIDFGDRRLNDRFLMTTSRLAAMPSAPINQACQVWSEAKATYRLFGNESVVVDEMIETHRDQTIERISKEKIAFAIQDTSYLEFNGHEKTTELGVIGKRRNAKIRGLVLHSAFCVNESGLPLGFLDLNCWARSDEKIDLSKNQRRKINKDLPINEKESFRWINSIERSIESTPNIITLADRESDISEFLCKAIQLKARFVIRGAYNRRIISQEYTYLREALEQVDHTERTIIDVPKRSNTPARKAEVKIKYSPITIKPSKRRLSAYSGIELNPININVVEITEINPTNEKDQINWLLLTGEAINSFDDAKKIVGWYKLRWNIEVFHKILKSGCRVEDCCLGSGTKLVKYITLMSIIGYRIFYLTRVSRQQPDLPCTVVLNDNEWKALYFSRFRTMQLPSNPPSLKEVTTWIAQLGGYLNRKNDGPPGDLVIWRGWQILTNFVAMWDSMGSKLIS